VEKGREVRTDFKNIARSLGRIGNSYFKLNDLSNAIKFYQKSLSEHRTADVLEKLREAEKLKEKADREAYQNPELADQARNRGNDLFKQGKFAEAVAEYTEAIKRAENDPRGYSNRAACYTKLMALSEALRDCDKAIQLDPNFVKAYIRKGAVQFQMKEFAKCVQTCDDALKIDAEHHGSKNHAEIEAQKQKATFATYGIGGGGDDENLSQEERAKRAMNDPKVQEILSDPVMRQILEQMSTDPAAARDHMKNPMIREKIQVLAAAGVIGLR
jgi:stress-induced-phosphoprotein 1